MQLESVLRGLQVMWCSETCSVLWELRVLKIVGACGASVSLSHRFASNIICHCSMHRLAVVKLKLSRFAIGWCVDFHHRLNSVFEARRKWHELYLLSRRAGPMHGYIIWGQLINFIPTLATVSTFKIDGMMHHRQGEACFLRKKNYWLYSSKW